MAKKLTDKEVDRRLFNRDIKRRSLYVNTTSPADLSCLIDGCNHEWTTTLTAIFVNGTGCPKCAGNIKLSNGEIDRRLLSSNIRRIGEYVNSSTPIKCQCTVDSCQYEWDLAPNSLRPNKSHKPNCCPRCAHRLKLTNEDVDRRLEGRPIKRVGNYIDINTPIQFHCLLKDCQHDWDGIPDGILNKRKSGCPKCAGIFPLTNEIIDARLQGKNIQRIGDYINAKTPIWFRCLIIDCGDEWKANSDGIGITHGCPTCGGSKSLSNEEIERRLIGRNIERLSDFTNTKADMDWRCLNDGCGHEWSANANNLFHPTNETGCPACAGSKNEKLVGKTLTECQLIYETQKPIKSIVKTEIIGLRIDFYLPQAMTIIEYNGRQHYEPVCFGNRSKDGAKELAEANFVKQQVRDQYLQKFCDRNGITLIWIDGRKYKGKRLKEYLIETIIPQLKKQFAA